MKKRNNMKRSRPGQPPKYESAEEFERKLDEYFKSITDADGNWTKPPTVSGMAIFLGFMDRRSMYHYRDNDKFFEPVKRAIGIVEQYHEEKVGGGYKCAGNIFALKNFGWTDRQEITNKGDMSIQWKEEKTYDSDEVDQEAD